MYCAETWTLRQADQKYLGRFEMWCWRRMENISWADRLKNEEYYTESRRGGTSYIKYDEERLTGLVTSCVGSAY